MQEGNEVSDGIACKVGGTEALRAAVNTLWTRAGIRRFHADRMGTHLQRKPSGRGMSRHNLPSNSAKGHRSTFALLMMEEISFLVLTEANGIERPREKQKPEGSGRGGLRRCQQQQGERGAQHEELPPGASRHSNRVPLMSREKSQSRKLAARRHIAIRPRKISKYSMTGETRVSIVRSSVIRWESRSTTNRLSVAA